MYANGDSEEIRDALAYIADSVGIVHEDEIARQVVQLCAGSQDPLHVGVDEVKRHMHEHMLDQRVVLVRVLQELLAVNTATRQIALCEGASHALRERLSGEDAMSEGEGEPGPGHTILDTKAMTVYLKTIDQITGIYKMPAMARLNGAAGGAPK
jgi:hypothetical protein